MNHNTNVVVFIHGFPNTPRLWDQQVAYLAPSCHTVCLDLQQLAATTKTPADYRLSSLTAAIIENIEELKAAHPGSPIYLVGHDLGCFLVDEVSRQRPQDITAQVLLNGTSLAAFASRLTSIRQLRRSYYIALLNLPFVPTLIRNRLTAICSKMIYDLAQVAVDSPLRTTAFNNFTPIAIYRELTRQALNIRLGRKSSKRSPVATVLVSATYDPFLVESSATEISRHFADATHHRLDGSHWSPVTHSSTINQILTTVIAAFATTPMEIRA